MKPLRYINVKLFCHNEECEHDYSIQYDSRFEEITTDTECPECGTEPDQDHLWHEIREAEVDAFETYAEDKAEAMRERGWFND